MRLLLLVAALVPAVALSQPAALADSTEAAAPDTTGTSDVALFSFVALADATRPIEAPPPEPEPPAPTPTPTLHVLGTSGVTFFAPIGWEGATSSVETAPYALYTARNETAAHALAGAVVRVERVTGLNPLLRERFTRGQTAYGSHGAAPVGPAAVPRGFGVEVRGPGVGGATAYIERGAVLWTVSVQAPAALWDARRSDVLALMAAVTLP